MAQALVLSLLLVGTAGFEPTTLCPPGRCATRLRYAPTDAAMCPPVRRAVKYSGLRWKWDQRRNNCSTSSSSMRTCLMIWLLSADSSRASGPSRRRRAPPMV